MLESFQNSPTEAPGFPRHPSNPTRTTPGEVGRHECPISLLRSRHRSDANGRSGTQLVESIVTQYGGRVVNNTGDGVLAAFDGPSRAAQCAQRLVDVMNDQGLNIRAGLHAGEVESRGSNVAGIAVHIAARVCALAGANEVLSTSKLRDLTAGSGISFGDRGDQELRVSLQVAQIAQRERSTKEGPEHRTPK